ncbi:MAG: hypothetical protein V2I43_19485 [Parvularcula sp.]|jgi:hypothetical protein|nr:hypothetical protein [Parvularcula sp.]
MELSTIFYIGLALGCVMSVVGQGTAISGIGIALMVFCGAVVVG